ncbi:MAG: hypothetical protein IPK25_16355 [Saprospiraceae bacterium]|nr:hypothetical protein [Saprospiraceae bacterium]
MNSIILFKGFVLNLSRMINKVVVSSHSESELIEEYRTLNKALGNALSKSIDIENETQFDSIQNRIESIQKELVHLQNMNLENADTRMLQKILEKKEMIIEFVRFKSFKSGIEGDYVYGAFILNEKK